MENFTVKELAEKLGATDAVAYGIVIFLVEKSVLLRTGERKRPDGKGKPSTLYSVTSVDSLGKLVAAFEPLLA